MTQPHGAPPPSTGAAAPGGTGSDTSTAPADLGRGPARLLAYLAAGLSGACYVLGFFDDIGAIAVGLVVAGGLLAAAATLPRAGRLLVPAAVVAGTGALVLLQFVVRAPLVSTVVVVALVVAFLLAGATAAAVLIDAGLLKLPAPKPRRPAGPVPAGYPQGYGYGPYPGYPPGPYGPGGPGYGGQPGGGAGQPFGGPPSPYPPGDQPTVYTGPAPYRQPSGVAPVPPSAPTRVDTGSSEWFARPDQPAPTPAAGVPLVSGPDRAGAPGAPAPTPAAGVPLGSRPDRPGTPDQVDPSDQPVAAPADRRVAPSDPTILAPPPPGVPRAEPTVIAPVSTEPDATTARDDDLAEERRVADPWQRPQN